MMMALSILIAHPFASGFALLLASYITSVLLTIFRPGLRNIPGPFLAKFTGLWKANASFKGQFHVVVPELHEKYGDIVRVGPNQVSIADPAALALIYGIRGEFIKSDFYLPFNPIVNHKPSYNIFTTPHVAEHRQIRSAISSKHSLAALLQMEYLVDEVSALMMKKMEKFAGNGNPFDFGDYIQWFAFDAIANLSFKRTLGFLETESDPYNIIASIEMFQTYASAVGSIPKFHYFIADNPSISWIAGLLPETLKEGRNGFAFAEKIAKEEIAAWDKKEEPGRGDFVEYLKGVQRKNPEKMSDNLVLGTITGNLVAGNDTTAVTLRAIFYFLMKNPRCYAVLQSEIDTAQEKGQLSEYVTWNEAQTLTYLHAVIKEALRLHPPFGMPLPRVVPENPPLICGKRLPPGTEVSMSAWALHKNKDVFGEDSDAFRPERWLESVSGAEQVKRMEHHFFSFGAGTRVCIGKHISMMEMTKIVPLIMRRWRIEWVGLNGAKEWKVATQAVARQTGLVVKLIERHRDLEGKSSPKFE